MQFFMIEILNIQSYPRQREACVVPKKYIFPSKMSVAFKLLYSFHL